MDPEDILENAVPNPLSEKTSLSSVTKAGELLGEGLSFVAIIRNVIFLIILALVLAIFLKIPGSIVTILVGTEILMAAIAGFIKIKKIKSVYSVGTQENAKSYRTILITSEYYEFIKAVFAFIASAISVSLIFLFFSHEISNFVIRNITTHTGLLKYIVLAFVIFRLFDLIVRSIRYGSIKNLKQSDDLAKVNQEYQLIDKKLQLIKWAPGMSVVLLILYLIGIPVFIILIFGGFLILMIILSIVELQRIKNISFNENPAENSNKTETTTSETVESPAIQPANSEYKDEQITGSVFGIMKTAAGFGDAFKPFGASVLGSGKNNYPENTLLITNYRILLIQVPVTGGDKIVGETDYVTQNFFFNRGEIKQQGEELLKSKTLPEILKLATISILFTDIKTLTLKQTQIIIEKTTGEKLSYLFMDRGYLDSVKQLFSLNLKEKFVIS